MVELANLTAREATETTTRRFGDLELSGTLRGRADERPPLVLLHGLSFDRRMWEPALAALSAGDPGRQVLALDLPGHGDSPMQPSADVIDVAAGVASAVEDAGLAAPVVVGHSIAAIIATVYASVHSARGIVNVDQPLDVGFAAMLQANREVVTGPAFPALWANLRAAMGIDLLSAEARALLDTGTPRQDTVLAYWREALEMHPAELQAKSDETVASLREQHLPYLVVAGHAWERGELARLHDALPQAKVEVIPDSGHFPHLRDPARFADYLATTGAWTRADV